MDDPKAHAHTGRPNYTPNVPNVLGEYCTTRRHRREQSPSGRTDSVSNPVDNQLDAICRLLSGPALGTCAMRLSPGRAVQNRPRRMSRLNHVSITR